MRLPIWRIIKVISIGSAATLHTLPDRKNPHCHILLASSPSSDSRFHLQHVFSDNTSIRPSASAGLERRRGEESSWSTPLIRRTSWRRTPSPTPFSRPKRRRRTRGFDMASGLWVRCWHRNSEGSSNFDS
ncbi:hypothetical protein DM860_004795 [Cuscuta australis]|uniref:Uncharacterized protein n=1 Tax=Cuscuta australis TaxID=267555 RepID=A0A328DM00_9ASTE|nr:hypothetical protein DM860_004795 [Cuscuta australis]